MVFDVCLSLDVVVVLSLCVHARNGNAVAVAPWAIVRLPVLRCVVVVLLFSVFHVSGCVIAWVMIHVIMFCVMILYVNLMIWGVHFGTPFRGLAFCRLLVSRWWSVCMHAMVMLFLWPLGPWGAHCGACPLCDVCGYGILCRISWCKTMISCGGFHVMT